MRLEAALTLLVTITSSSGLITTLPSTLVMYNVPTTSRTRPTLSSSPDSEQEKSAPFPLENSISNMMLKFRTASSEGFGTRARNVASTCQVGDIVVPLCGDLEKRRLLADRGIYPGVEYLVVDLKDAGTMEESFGIAEIGRNLEEQPSLGNKSAQDRIATVCPAYPLRAHLERPDWPVSVQLSDVPLWLSKTTYEAGTALGTFMLAGSYLAMASIVATLVRIAVIPSESMIPALMPGDVSLDLLPCFSSLFVDTQHKSSWVL